MMKRLTLYIFSLLLSLTAIHAQENYKVSISDKHRIVTGSIEVNKADKVIFANALVWAIEQGEKYKELLADIDFDKMRMVIDYNLSNEGESSFTSKLTLQVSQGRLVYLVDNIKGQSSGLASMLGTTLFDKMNPEKKPKQKALIEEFEALNKKGLAKLFDYVRNHDTDVSKWDCIAENRLEKGMTVEDVTMILGKPINIQKSNTTIQYMYNTFTYVFFEDGKLKSFMQ